MSAADDFREAKRQNAIVQDAFSRAFESYTERFDALWGSCRDIFAGVPRDEDGVPDMGDDDAK